MNDRNELLKTIPCALLLLTARRGDEINAMPVSWLGQVSAEPALIQIAVKPERYTHDMIRDTGIFGLVFMDESFKDEIPGFKLKGDDKSQKFADYDISDSPAGLPVLGNAVGWMDCGVVSMVRPGDHTLFVGEITAAKMLKKGDVLTLAHFGKDYHYGIE